MIPKDELILAGLGAIGIAAAVGLTSYGLYAAQSRVQEARQEQVAHLKPDGPMMKALNDVSPQAFIEIQAMLRDAENSSRAREILPGRANELIERTLIERWGHGGAADDQFLVGVAKAQSTYFDHIQSLGNRECAIALGETQARESDNIFVKKTLSLSNNLTIAMLRAMGNGQLKPERLKSGPAGGVEQATFNAVIAGMKANKATPEQISYIQNPGKFRMATDETKCRGNVILSRSVAQLPTPQIAEYWRMRFRSPPKY